MVRGNQFFAGKFQNIESFEFAAKCNHGETFQGNFSLLTEFDVGSMKYDAPTTAY